MKQFRKTIYAILISLTLFLALTAILGGVALLANLNTPPVSQLGGTPFKDWTIPGLSLALIVGGSALLAAILLLRKSKFAPLSTAAAGTIIMFFEFVEVLMIGSPAGIGRTLQIFYFAWGTGIEIFSLGLWFLELLSNPG